MNIITIDGVVASGKSTLARMIAHELHYYYLCSGLLYRSLAYVLVHIFGYTQKTITHINIADIAQCFDPQRFEYRYDTEHQERIFFDGQDITPLLKDSLIDTITSITSVNIHVRQCVTNIQHMLASDHNIVIDGRDVGSVVFPHAQVKFYVTAAIEVRAERWLLDQKKHGHVYTVQQAIEKIADRDNRDRERTVAPLIIPEGAIVIDTSDMSIQEAYALMLEAIREVLK